MRPTPFLMKKCDLLGCERQAHFTLDDGRVICDWHALLWGASTKVLLAHNEEQRKKLPDFNVEIEGEDREPGDETPPE